MTPDTAQRDLARTLLAVGTPPTEVIELLIGQAWTAVLVTCRPTSTLLSDILTDMAKELDNNRLRPRVARMALESAGIDPLLLALHADRICKKGDPLVLAKILARGLGVPEAMVKRISTGWWTPSVFFPLPFPDLGVDLMGLSDEDAQALRDGLGSGRKRSESARPQSVISHEDRLYTDHSPTWIGRPPGLGKVSDE